MKPICLTILALVLLLVSSMPSVIPGTSDRAALAFIGIVAFLALLLTEDSRP